MTPLLRRIGVDGWALLPLRVLTGLGFAAHGYAKLSRGPATFGAVLAAMGIPAPGAMAWATSVLELVGGISLVLGAAVMLLSVPLGAVMATAMFKVHLAFGFSSIKLLALNAAGPQFGPPGYELNLLYVAALVALALSRPGPLSVDRWLEARRRSLARSPARPRAGETSD